LMAVACESTRAPAKYFHQTANKQTGIRLCLVGSEAGS
jgi:hypothetical protein